MIGKRDLPFPFDLNESPVTEFIDEKDLVFPPSFFGADGLLASGRHGSLECFPG